MRLSTLKIRNFRGIRSLDLRLDRDVIVLIGENNSGKTSILEAMRIGLNMIKSDKAASFSEYDFYRDQQAADLSHCDSIKLVFIFKETKEHPWDEQITRALSDVIILDNYQTIKLSIIVRFDAEEGVIKQSFGFLNDADNEMQMQQGKQQRFLKEFKKLRPFFCQSALRAAKDEFQAQGSFWSSFLGSKTLDPAARLQLEDELNQINHHVRRNRGELLFARKWLLVEGETDVSVIAECADLLDIDLNVHGIRIIECSQAGGPGIFIKVADALNIDWHLVADNDQGGEKCVKAAKELLQNRPEADYITVLSQPNMDVMLCVAGYGEPYLSGLAAQSANFPDASWEEVIEEIKKTFPNKPGQALNIARKLEDRSTPEITAKAAEPGYWSQVCSNLKRNFSKPAAALEALMEMRKRGKDGVPVEIKGILQKISGQQEGVSNAHN